MTKKINRSSRIKKKKARRREQRLKSKESSIIQSIILLPEDVLWESICDEDLIPLCDMKRLIHKYVLNTSDILEKIKPTQHGIHQNKNKNLMHMAIGGNASIKTLEIVKILLEIMYYRAEEERKRSSFDNYDTTTPIEALTIVTPDKGETPLHLACGVNYSRRSQVREEEVIQLVLKTIGKHQPTARRVMAMQTYDYGDTVLHTMCRRHKLQLSLYQKAIQLYPDALSMMDNRNNTPLHTGIKNIPSFEINEYLIRETPYEALHIVDDEGRTVLHTLCETMDQRAADLIPILIKRAPILCFMLDNNGFLPYDSCVHCMNLRPLPHKIDEFGRIVDKTEARYTNTLKCLYESMMATTKSLLSLNSTNDSLLMFTLELLYHDQNNNTHIKQALFCKYIRENEPLQNLLMGIERMNAVGRRTEALQDSGNKKLGVQVIDSVIDNLDCIYLHLRETPSLCK